MCPLEVKNKFQSLFPGLRLAEPLKFHCSYHLGGPAEFFYELKNLEKLPSLIEFCVTHKIPFFILGKGTNVLFPDEGFKGLIIKITADQMTIRDREIVAETGVGIGQFLKKMEEHQLTGVENDLTLPGTIGGMIRGNATRLGAIMSDFLTKVDYYDSTDHQLKTLPKEALAFNYRHSFFKKRPDLIILRGYFTFPKATPEEIKVKKFAAIKISRKYPSEHNCGSFFKNPDPDKPSGWLIEQCGLKGFRVGDAQVSLQHANFLVNLGNATAADILKLAAIIKEKVLEKFGIELEEEVVIVRNVL